MTGVRDTGKSALPTPLCHAEVYFEKSRRAAYRALGTASYWLAHLREEAAFRELVLAQRRETA